MSNVKFVQGGVYRYKSSDQLYLLGLVTGNYELKYQLISLDCGNRWDEPRFKDILQRDLNTDFTYAYDSVEEAYGPQILVKHPLRGHLYRHSSGDTYIGVALPDVVEGKICLVNLGSTCTNSLYSNKGIYDDSVFTHIGLLEEVES